MYVYLYTFKESGMQNCESACFNNYWGKKMYFRLAGFHFNYKNREIILVCFCFLYVSKTFLFVLLISSS